MKIKIVMPYTGEISVNRYLGHSPSGALYTRGTAEIWGMVLKGAINSMLPMGYNPDWINESAPFRMDMLVKFPRKFSKRSGDAPNFDKFPRDIVASTLGIDDAGSDGEPKGEYGFGEEARIEISLDIHTTFKVDQEPRILCLA